LCDSLNVWGARERSLRQSLRRLLPSLVASHATVALPGRATDAREEPAPARDASTPPAAAAAAAAAPAPAADGTAGGWAPAAAPAHAPPAAAAAAAAPAPAAAGTAADGEAAAAAAAVAAAAEEDEVGRSGVRSLRPRVPAAAHAAPSVVRGGGGRGGR